MKILVLPGGGAAGYSVATFLQHLDQALPNDSYKSLADRFDLVAGVSTGAIIGTALCAGIPTREIAEFYQMELPRIFRKEHWWSGWISSAKYPSEALHQALCQILPGDWMDLRPKCMTYALEVEPQIRPKHWKSWLHSARISDVLMATCAAPSYLRPWVITDEPGDPGGTYVDGGVICADPVMHAVAEALRLGHQPKDLKILKLNPYGYGGKLEDAQNVRSALQWVPHIGRVFLEGGNESADYQARQLLPQMFSLELRTPTAMDDASSRALGTMATNATNLWTDIGPALIDWLRD